MLPLAILVLAAAHAERLHPAVVTTSLPALAAARPALAGVARWIEGTTPAMLGIALDPCGEALVVADDSGAILPLSPEQALDLARLSRYHDGVDRAALLPVPHEAIARATSSRRTAAELARLFDRVHRGPRVADRLQGGTIPFEPGGVAYMVPGGAGAEPYLELVVVADPVHTLARALLAARDNPRVIPGLLARNPFHTLGLDEHGLLAAALERHPPSHALDARGRLAIGLALGAVAANVADSYGFDETTLAQALVDQELPGGARYAGRWHGHPGLLRGGAGDVPSEEDKAVAAATGRYLTVVERGAGFDLHDLRPGAADPAPVAVAAAPPDLILVYLTDLHSSYERYPALLAAVDRAIAARVASSSAILIGGDLFERGNRAARSLAGAPDWDLLAALRERAPVVFNLGNHDADVTPGGFAAVVARAAALGVSVIGGPRDRTTGERFAAGSATLAAGTRRISVLGVAPDRADVFPADLRDAIALDAPLAAVHGATLPVVVLSHAGVAADRRILAAVPDGSLVLGGHDHVRRLAVRGGTTYLQGGAFAESIDVVSLRFVDDRAAPIVDVESVPIAGGGALEARVASSLTAEDLAVVATVARDLPLAAAAGLAVEAVREAAGADVAFLNHTSFGSGLEPGPISRARFERYLRFDNPVVVAETDGATLAAILAFAARSRGPDLDQASGDFVYAGEVAAEPGRRYRVATSDWVAGRARAYLGTEALHFTPLSGATTRTIVTGALTGGATAR